MKEHSTQGMVENYKATNNINQNNVTDSVTIFRSYWSTNFKYLLNSAASCTLVLRGMDWNFPDGVDAMLQLTGESA